MESSCHELKWNFKLGNLVKHIQRLTKLSDMAFEGRLCIVDFTMNFSIEFFSLKKINWHQTLYFHLRNLSKVPLSRQGIFLFVQFNTYPAPKWFFFLSFIAVEL